MSLLAAELVIAVLAAYAAVGIALAMAMLLGGLRRVDSAAAAAPLRVKLLWVPGMIALWPVMLARALGWRPREDRP
jgi:hypothetical protein